MADREVVEAYEEFTPDHSYSREKTHPCDECGAKFDQPAKVARHKADVHGGRDSRRLAYIPPEEFEAVVEEGELLSTSVTLQCPTCQMFFSDRLKFALHKRKCDLATKRSGRISPELSLPAFVTPSRRGRRASTQQLYPEARVTTVKRQYRRSNGDRRETYRPPNPFICAVCERTFTEKIPLEAHLFRQHLEIRPYACPFCDRTYVHPKVLGDHIKKHQKPPPKRSPMCPFCMKRFLTREQLDQHENAAHAEALLHGLHTCPYCFNQVIGGAEVLRQHMEVHLSEKQLPIECGLCGDVYMSEHNFKRHMSNIHNCGTLYTCKTCNKKFLSKRHFGDHTRKHEEPDVEPEIEKKKRRGVINLVKKVFDCRHCGEIFPQKKVLKVHLHEAHKMLEECPQCGKIFSTPKSLRLHILCTHQNSAPRKCELCQKSFGSNSNWNYHMWAYHSAEGVEATAAAAAAGTSAGH